MSDYFDFASHSAGQKDFNYYEQSFHLYPKALNALVLPVSLSWQTIKFTPANVKSLTEERGIYAFVVAHPITNLPVHGYILYFGQTGAEKKNRTIRQRAKDYLREKVRPKRVQIFEFLNKWEDHLYFHYATIPDKTVDLLEIESKLNDAVIPPYVINDFGAEIRKRKKIGSFK